MIKTVGELKKLLEKYSDECPIAIVTHNKMDTSYIQDAKEVMIRKDGTEITFDKNCLTELGKRNFNEGIAFIGRKMQKVE